MSASNVRPFAIPGSSGVVGPQSTNGPVTYYGVTVLETTGTDTALIRLRANGVIGGTIIDTISLTAGESTREWYGPQGINAGSGVYCELVSGAVAGTIRSG